MISGSRFLQQVETGFALVALFLGTEAIVPLLRSEAGYERDPVAGDPVMQAIWTVLYVVTLLLCGLRWRTTLRIALRNPALLCLIGLAVVSAIWSAAPVVTLRRDFVLVGMSLAGVLIGSRFSISRQIDLVAIALGTAAVLSLVFSLAQPAYG